MKRSAPDIAEASAITTALSERLPRDLTGYDRTAWVIAQLLAQGRRPTNEMVRAVLGQGSPNTIKEHADEFFRRNVAQAVTPTSAIDALLRRHFREVYDLVRVQVEGDFAGREATLVEERRALATQQAAVEALAAEAEARERGSQQAVEVMRTQLEAVQGEMRGVQGRLGSFQGQLEREQTEKNDLRQRLEDCEKRLAAAAKTHDVAIARARREATESCEARRAELQRTLDALRTSQREVLAARDKRIERLEADLRAALEGAKTARADASRWHGAHQKLEQQHQALQRAHTALANRLVAPSAAKKKIAGAARAVAKGSRA